mmetsp:Transcript_25766/g.47014  ORF Transcript_25766/g.47014 Transcript_25766/m.47014 type:complete len:134 (-) Transcript_25766:82-483(-)|eukprot:CAMPEP_0175050820 /NCGR_PEP_ID=MMETSP0052_2-20121109/7461_1 /TAXON_ID=51329 ORGANISM="Polytomella parva, Strain SAG 63-3" /NCGR_SAMPLE_ID=MMETSP0052_2 /ASSEMBLY_ACC=CAM_ASM_000194 /LENGTH=133 /DNA_ID=CAMNT_0016315045 /DNA_START=350 /DNA_END=751 /DNA_ORIENTATION=-
MKMDLIMDNYFEWSRVMEAIMDSCGLMDLMDGRQDPNENPADEKFAYATLITHLSKEMVLRVKGCSTSSEVWNQLFAMNHTSVITRRMSLLNELQDIKKKSKESMAEYLDRVKNITNELESIGESISLTSEKV